MMPETVGQEIESADWHVRFHYPANSRGNRTMMRLYGMHMARNRALAKETAEAVAAQGGYAELIRVDPGNRTDRKVIESYGDRPEGFEALPYI